MSALPTAGRFPVRRKRPNRPAVDNASRRSWCPHQGVRLTLQELKFQQALIEFAPKEANALGAYSEIVKRLQAGTLDRAGAAHEIEFSIIPQWDKLYDSLSAAKLAVDSKRLDVQHGLTLYCDFRRKHLRLVSAALRTGDPRIEKDAAQTLEQVQAQIETVKRVAKAR